MKQIIQKLTAVLLAVMLSLSFAADLPVYQVRAEDGNEISETVTYENPLYSELSSADQLKLSRAEINALSDSIDKHYIEELRAELVSRNADIAITIPYVDDYEDAAHYMWDQAVETYTGNPKEGDYLGFQYGSWSCDINGNTSFLTYTYHVTYYTDAQQEAKVDQAVQNLIDDLGIRYKNDYQKIYNVYEWIAKHVKYEYDYATVDTMLIYTAYGALINNVAVCQGYAVLFCRMMLELGIDCRVISGIGNGEGHAWNIVKIGDLYYDIDVTWAATTEDHEEYFLRGSKNFSDHASDDEYLTSEFRSKYPIDPNDYKVTAEDLEEDDVCQGAVLNERELSLDVGQTYQLTAQVLPLTYSQKVTWASDNTKAAKVDSKGLVTAVSAGTANISATAEAGGKTAVCKITVSEIEEDSGHAYCIRTRTDENTGRGDLIFFRSKNLYDTGEESDWQTVTDLYGNEYEGQVYAIDAEIEGEHCDYPNGKSPWYNARFATLRIYTAPNQTVHIKNMSAWFADFMEVEEFDGTGFDTSECIDFADTFSNCQNLKTANVKPLDTSNTRSVAGMFWRCKSLTEADLSSFNTDKCTGMSELFWYCPALKKVDLSSFNTAKMSGSMMNLFQYSDNIQEIKLGKGFTVWTNNSYFPEGTWTNGTITKTEKELYEEYPSHASEWAGTWKKVSTPVHVQTVRLNKSSLTLEEGQSETLTAAVSPDNADNKNITWSSSDPEVASVDQNGKITALKEGQTLIYATADDNGVNAWCSLTVKAKTAVIPVTGVRINKSEITLKVGENTSIETTVLPENATDKTYSWASSDSRTVFVSDKGTVIGSRAGTAVLTVTTKDGGFTATCTVHVISDTAPAPESVRITVSNAAVNVGSFLKLKAAMSPSDADQTVTWTSSDTSRATVDADGTVHGKKVGTVTLTAKTVNGKTAACTVKVLFTDVPDTGVYYSDPVYWAVNKGITNGYTDHDGLAREFRPKNNCTREAVVTFLWRLAGKPNPRSMTSPFRDVKDSSKYYYKAVLWAAEKGITGGYDDGTFRPDATCLREHVVTFLYRYAGKPGIGTSTNPFNDIRSSDYYYKPVLWAVSRGITNGYSSGPNAGGFGPKLDCLREHVVTFLYRYANQK